MDIKTLIDISINSNIAKSCRRIFFNHLENTNHQDEFHVDIMHGSGSGTLIFYDGKFFLLTAKHVIDKNINEKYQNASPFWISVNKNPNWGSLSNFLFPKYYYEIGSLISCKYKLIDNDDVCLIELFNPMPLHYPDHFIDLTKNNCFIEKDEFIEGLFLIANGYPFELNSFDHDYNKDGFTHSTNVIRHSAPGICIIEDDTPHISYEITDKNSMSHDGMSGGVVCNAWDSPEKVKWAGLTLSGGNKITRFLPAWCIFNAITSYKKAIKHIIDPAADTALEPNEVLEIYSSYIDIDVSHKKNSNN